MTHRISDETIDRLREYVSQHLGLDFPERNRDSLKRRVLAAASEFGENETQKMEPEDFVRLILAPPFTKEKLELLARHLSVGETWFFRDWDFFQVLEETILPGLFKVHKEKKGLNIWSAGCSSGEEPYSLAILIDRMIPDGEDWNIRLVATDINTHSLKKARSGVYNNWSFRELPNSIRNRYFSRIDAYHHEIAEKVKKMVTFGRCNLALMEKPEQFREPESLDLILCRNVLMYFNPSLREKAIDHLAKLLCPNGTLILGAGETGFVKHFDLITEKYPELILFRKKNRFPQDSVPAENFSNEEPSTPEITSVPDGTDRGIESEPLSLDSKMMRKPMERARHLFEKGLEFEALREISECLCGGGNMGVAGSRESMALIAKFLMGLGKLEQALKWSMAAVNTDKPHPEHGFILAKIYQELGRFQEAEKTLEEILHRFPDFIPAHFLLGNLAYLMNHHEKAKAHFEKIRGLFGSPETDIEITKNLEISPKQFRQILDCYFSDLPA